MAFIKVFYVYVCVCARVCMCAHTHVFEVEMRRYGGLGESDQLITQRFLGRRVHRGDIREYMGREEESWGRQISSLLFTVASGSLLGLRTMLKVAL